MIPVPCRPSPTIFGNRRFLRAWRRYWRWRLRKNRAQTRYLLWLSASVKFLVPVFAAGGRRQSVRVAKRCSGGAVRRWRWQWNKSASPLRHRVTPVVTALPAVPMAPKVLGRAVVLRLRRRSFRLVRAVAAHPGGVCEQDRPCLSKHRSG